MPFRRVEVPACGVRLSVVDDGPRDGKPILFVHGNPTWSYLWRKLMGPAKDAGFRVVAPDHAGFGLSEKPLTPGYYHLQRHVDNLRQVMTRLDLRDATLVLHDWGGPIGMGAAVGEPDRVARIVIANTTAFAPRKSRPFSRWHKLFASPLGQRAAVELNLVQLSAMLFANRRPLDLRAHAAYVRPMRSRGARIAAARFVKMVPDGPDHPEAATLRGIESSYHLLEKKPMLVLWADRDPVMPARLAERWLERFPEARVEHVSRAGHFWQEEDPEPFLRRLLAFASAPD